MTTYPVAAYPLTQQAPSPLGPRFPRWQREYEAAVSEADTGKLLERVHAAEAAIFKRLQELAENSDSPSRDAEHQAIADAIRALRILTRDKLQFPDWEVK
jgi:hypothetical protein